MTRNEMIGRWAFEKFYAPEKYAYSTLEDGKPVRHEGEQPPFVAELRDQLDFAECEETIFVDKGEGCSCCGYMYEPASAGIEVKYFYKPEVMTTKKGRRKFWGELRAEFPAGTSFADFIEKVLAWEVTPHGN